MNIIRKIGITNMRIFTNPKRHTVIITENQMNKINESSSDVETYYRACSRDEAEGKFKLFSLWLTPDDFYAKEYLDNEPNKVIVEYKIDENLLNPASIYEMVTIVSILNMTVIMQPDYVCLILSQ